MFLTTETRPARLTLRATTAAELMTPNPISVRADATAREALAFLCDRGFTAAPVTDEAGRPVGVLSQTDVLVHDREESAKLAREPEFYTRAELHTLEGEPLPTGFEVERVDPTPVTELMTPMVFAVAPTTPAAEVVEKILDLKVHRLFVIDDAGVLVGVVTTTDVLRHLRP